MYLLLMSRDNNKMEIVLIAIHENNIKKYFRNFKWNNHFINIILWFL